MPNKDINVLCLSLRTPPEIRPQAILIGKMVPEWVRQGVKPVIVSYGGEDWDIDLPRYRIPQRKHNRVFDRVPALRRSRDRKYLDRLMDFFGPIIKEHQIGLVFSFANPQFSNVIGAGVKKRFGVRFVANFSDPWYDSGYKPFSKRAADDVLRQETGVVEAADRIVFVSEQLRDMVMKKYPAAYKEKCRVIPHCYDPKDYPADARRTDSDFIISYIGVFYKERNPEILFKILKKAISDDAALASKLKIRLVGGANPYAGYTQEKIESLLEQYGLKDRTEMISTVPFRESLRLMKSSDCLVTIDANFGTSPFLPSKVIDYAGSGKPVVGITPHGSTVSGFLDRLGERSFGYDEVAEAAAYLKDLINGKTSRKIDTAFLEQFHVRNTTAKLLGIFKEL
ncbi:MAG: glycosyltransferase [Minisyncoccia bacterium]|jgi:glycosyltransferase involved in cell wall biosynthesis